MGNGHRVSTTLVAVLGVLVGVGSAAAQQFADVDAAVRQGIRRGLYSGAAVVIGRRDTVLYSRGYGHVIWSGSAPVPNPDSTIWDIASLTKVVATTSAAIRLIDAGRLGLDAPVTWYLPEFAGGEKGRVTIRMLLDHTSGLPSYLPFYRLARTREAALERLYAEPLLRAPGDSAAYSDLNAMLLGVLIERVAATGLDEFARTEVFQPLGMQRTMFRPSVSLQRWVVPSGKHRGRPVRGRVNDENAVRLGGVAGHAGLFSTAADLGRYAQAWLRNGVGPYGPWARPETLRQFLTPGARSGTRLLGWDSPDPDPTPDDPSVFGSLVSPSAYGHTGWTGTEIWIDPARDLFLVFLTNRSFDPRTRRSIEKMKLVRAEVSDAVARLVPGPCRPELVAAC
ncbi:MAG TPA: serine hydrolase domain-containing protein [Gemmatimonadales bacterium]|nr:serine hydrolase domain-containing protein [Gemmatimonadales bacterium]